jgi:hypothetical protein
VRRRAVEAATRAPDTQQQVVGSIAPRGGGSATVLGVRRRRVTTAPVAAT